MSKTTSTETKAPAAVETVDSAFDPAKLLAVGLELTPDGIVYAETGEPYREGDERAAAAAKRWAESRGGR